MYDVQMALRPVLNKYNTKNKFWWFPACWHETADVPSPQVISKAFGVPRLEVMVPSDVAVASRAINAGVPYILENASSLAAAMLKLCRHFDPNIRAGLTSRGSGLGGSLKRMFVGS